MATYTCDRCGYSSKQEWRTRPEKHDCKPVYACDICDYTSLQEWRTRPEKHDCKPVYTCDLCDYTSLQEWRTRPEKHACSGKIKTVKKEAKVEQKAPKSEITMGVAFSALILNIIVPGLGSMVGDRTRQGTLQLLLFIIGLPLSFLLIGIPLVVGSWIWGILTGFQLIHEARLLDE